MEHSSGLCKCVHNFPGNGLFFNWRFFKSIFLFRVMEFDNVPKPNANMDLTSSPQRKLFLSNEFCENVMKFKRSLPGRFFTFLNTSDTTINHVKHIGSFLSKEKKIIVLFVFQALTQKVVKMYENDVRSWLSKRKKNQRKKE